MRAERQTNSQTNIYTRWPQYFTPLPGVTSDIHNCTMSELHNYNAHFIRRRQLLKSGTLSLHFFECIYRVPDRFSSSSEDPLHFQSFSVFLLTASVHHYAHSQIIVASLLSFLILMTIAKEAIAPVPCEPRCRWCRYELRPRWPKFDTSRLLRPSTPWSLRLSAAAASIRNARTIRRRRSRSISERSWSDRRLDPTGSARAASSCRRLAPPAIRAVSRTPSARCAPEMAGSRTCCRAERQTPDQHSSAGTCPSTIGDSFNTRKRLSLLDRGLRSDRPRYCVTTPIRAGHRPLTLTCDIDLIIPPFRGELWPWPHKQSLGQSVQNIELKQTDGQTDTTVALRFPLTRLVIILFCAHETWRGGAMGRALDLRSTGREFISYSGQKLRNNLRQVVYTYLPLSPSSITWYRQGRWCSAAGKVTAGLAKSNGSLQPGGWLIFTCGLTAYTPGSAPGPTLGDEYGKPLPFREI